MPDYARSPMRASCSAECGRLRSVRAGVMPKTPTEAQMETLGGRLLAAATGFLAINLTITDDSALR